MLKNRRDFIKETGMIIGGLIISAPILTYAQTSGSSSGTATSNSTKTSGDTQSSRGAGTANTPSTQYENRSPLGRTSRGQYSAGYYGANNYNPYKPHQK